MASSYFYIDKKYRKLIADLSANGILGLKDASTWQIFCLAMALGAKHPLPLQNRDSYARVEYLRSEFESNALIEAVSIARAENDTDVDRFATLNEAEEYTEQLANSGFEKLLQMYEEMALAGEGRELFERRLESELETLYLQNVENDI